MTVISLCSYTYNDAPLLHGLLENLRTWPRLPDEIVLLDDGSSVPFELTEKERDLPIRLICLPQNTGFRAAKNACLGAATGDIIVGMDCDARLKSGNFIENAIKMLSDPAVGLLGVADACQDGDDLLSAYLAYTEALPPERTQGEIKFVSGGVFAMRRELWEKIGGYSGYDKDLAEDYYLCVRLRQNGYKLLLDMESQVRYARFIDRLTFCRRSWKCYEDSWMAALSPHKAFTESLDMPLFIAKRHCSEISSAHPLSWIYFELLNICHMALMFCKRLGATGAIPVSAQDELLRLLQTGLSKHPLLHRLLKADLMRLASLPLGEAVPPKPGDASALATSYNWSALELFLRDLDEGLALEYLDKVGVQEILNDEGTLEKDFSSY